MSGEGVLSSRRGAEAQGNVERPRYLLVKRGLYYRPENRGYTGIKDYAGRYFAHEARPDSGVTAVHEDDAPEYAEDCFHDLAAQHFVERVQALSAALGALLAGKTT